MTNKLFIFVFLLATYSCSQNTDVDQYGSKATNLECSKIIIRYCDYSIPVDNYYWKFGFFSTKIIYEAKEKKLLNVFEQMLKESDKTGYCCCPHRDLYISFFNKTDNFKDYFVDTLEYKNRIRIFETNYQFSYIVEKNKWKSFLTQLSIINFKEYFISDLDLARKVYEYTLKNELSIVTSKKLTKEWMHFDGDFKVKISTVGEKLSEKKIYENIAKTYPNDNYKFETIGHYKKCGDSKVNDCYEEYILQIFCNKDFFDNFNLYAPKSFYEKAIANFCVLGSTHQLDEIDKIVEK